VGADEAGGAGDDDVLAAGTWHGQLGSRRVATGPASVATGCLALPPQGGLSRG
jgi:hypothetical protein